METTTEGSKIWP